MTIRLDNPKTYVASVTEIPTPGWRVVIFNQRNSVYFFATDTIFETEDLAISYAGTFSPNERPIVVEM